MSKIDVSLKKKKKESLSAIVCTSNVGARANSRLKDLRMLMKDYTIVIIWGKPVGGWKFGESVGKPQTLWNCIIKFMMELSTKRRALTFKNIKYKSFLA